MITPYLFTEKAWNVHIVLLIIDIIIKSGRFMGHIKSYNRRQ